MPSAAILALIAAAPHVHDLPGLVAFIIAAGLVFLAFRSAAQPRGSAPRRLKRAEARKLRPHQPT